MATKRAKSIESLDRNFAAQKTVDPGGLKWRSATDRQLTVRGLAWFKANTGRFSRLPLRAEKIVREPVWQLAQCPAGGRVCFRSDTTAMSVRLTNADTGFMPHMPMSGSNGCILYAGNDGVLQPWATATPEPQAATFERQLFKDVPRKMREFCLYLPLYKALEKLEIGLPAGARLLLPSPPALAKPVVVYGTSITQGGCANTAGSDFVSVVGRHLNLDVVNLGFSGNGRGEPEMAELISEIDASLFVLDYAANTNAQEFEATLPRFVEILRRDHPQTPILLMTNVCFSQYGFNPGHSEVLDARRDFAMEFYAQRRRRCGDRNFHLVDGFGLLPFGVDGAFVDGVHPTDHGFMLMAERLAPAIAQILFRDR